jgi:hypothetical protein
VLDDVELDGVEVSTAPPLAWVTIALDDICELTTSEPCPSWPASSVDAEGFDEVDRRVAVITGGRCVEANVGVYVTLSVN